MKRGDSESVNECVSESERESATRGRVLGGGGGSEVQYPVAEP